MTDVVAAGMPAKRVWVSHLSDTELADLRHRYADFEFRPRFGTQLWLGDREAAMADRQVNRRVKVRIGELFNYVRTNNPDLRRAVGDKGGHIKRTHADHPHVRPFTGKG